MELVELVEVVEVVELSDTVPFALLLNRAFHPFLRRKPQRLPSRWDRRSLLWKKVATTSIPSITNKPPNVISTLLDDAGVQRTTVPEPSAVGTIIGDDAGLAFTAGLPEISLVGVSLGRAPLRSLRSCGPNSIGESICSF